MREPPLIVEVPMRNIIDTYGQPTETYLRWWEARGVAARIGIVEYSFVTKHRDTVRVFLRGEAKDHALEFKLRWG